MTKNPKTIIGLFEQKYCKEGINGRDDFEQRAEAYIVAELVKGSRKKAHLTHDELAEKLNVKRTYISKIERALNDVRISILRNYLNRNWWQVAHSCGIVRVWLM